MAKNFVEGLRWRGILHDLTPDTEQLLQRESVIGYIGFDPTADSLHIGSLAPIILLKHFQQCGHTPIVLLGGATGMIGDPSGKSEERKLLDEATLQHNLEKIKQQLSRFLVFDNSDTGAVLVNNYDWMKSFSLIDFIRDIGKHITVNYMKSKDSVKKRLEADSESGMSFTEFTYQLFQAYDFAHLYRHKNCVLQMGGSDQWGNITTGIELIRRLYGDKVHALTCKLLTKADGTKFGKTASGNVWLDPCKTSPYKFYQYWLNTEDVDAKRYIKIFTFLSKSEIERLLEEHDKAPHRRVLQKKIAEQLTTTTHGIKDLEQAQKASQILFGNASIEELQSLDTHTLVEVLDGIPTYHLSFTDIENGMDIVGALSTKTRILSSNAEARRTLKANAISVNKQKIGEHYLLKKEDLIRDTYILLQKGKKNYYLLVFE